MGKMVYLLWESDSTEKWVDGVYANKIDAEATMRQLKEQDEAGGRSYTYWIQEKEVQ